MADFVDLDALKDDLGITGSADDAWLARRVAGALARMSVYTHRYIGPLATFIDQWRPESEERSARIYWAGIDGASFYLRNFPVKEITTALDEGNAVAGTIVDNASGKLIGYGNVASPNHFTAPTVTYVAGWDTLPADLYEVLVGVIAPQWENRANVAAGIDNATKVSIQDVGDLDFSGAVSGTAFERAAMSGVSDPLLGPYAAILDGYTDRRSSIGSVYMPRTSDPVLVTP